MEERGDLKLIQAYREGDRQSAELLLTRYKGLVQKNAKSFFLIGGDRDDLMQEGMLGLFSAIQTFDVRKNASFFSFANLCIRRQMIKAIETSQTKKNYPLNSAISLELEEETGGLPSEVAQSGIQDPLERLLDEEAMELLLEDIREELSPMEDRVLSLQLEGLDYIHIADRLGRSPKSIDNALGRIKRKIRARLGQRRRD